MLKTLEPTPVVQQLLTGEELAVRDDLGRGELIAGVFNPMPPPNPQHGITEMRISMYLGLHVEENDLGFVMGGEAGIYIKRNPDTIRAVDAAFISHERFAQWTEGTYLTIAPEIVIEVLSPRDRWMDVNDKIEEYFSIDVQLVWIVDPRRQEVTVFESPGQGNRLTQSDTLTGGHVLPEFALSLEKLFKFKK